MSHGKTDRGRERGLGAERKTKRLAFSIGESILCRNQSEYRFINANN